MSHPRVDKGRETGAPPVDWIYLDCNATTQPAEAVVEAMAEVHRELWANPSSVHRFGQLVRHALEGARQRVARLVGAPTAGVTYTSGGTEANNLALAGVAARSTAAPGRRFILVTTPVEHAAIREPAAALEEAGCKTICLPVDINGLVTAEALDEVLNGVVSEAHTVLVSIQWANNETGVIQPMAELAEVCRRHAGDGPRDGLLFHSDATQAVGKIPVDMGALGLDLMTLSAHKFHGPKGVGALCLRRGLRTPALLRGGPQERGRRGGTENTAGIVGMGAAAELAATFLEDTGARDQLAALRDGFESRLCRTLPNTVINGGTAPQRLWNTTNLGFPRLEAEAILIALSETGICASAGAACSSGSLEPSPVLLAAGIPEEVAHGSVRFSFSRFACKDDLESAAEGIERVVPRVGRAMVPPA